MGYTFPPEIAEKVRRLMESGKYQSEVELVFEALGALEQDEMQIDALKADIAKGVEEADRGLAQPLELEAFLKRMRERYAAAAVVPSDDDLVSEIAARWKESETDDGEPLDADAAIARLETRLSS